MTVAAWATIAIFVGVYVLVATERIHRVAAALGGAAVVLGFGIVGSEEVFYSRETGIDWDVLALLLGMMVIVGVIRRTGVFEYVAIRSAKLARGRPFRVLVLLVLVTALASAVLDNVTTVLLIAPVTFLVCERLGLEPVPFLIAEALASNIGGTATLVGDPPNIVIASRSGLTFVDFLWHLLPVALMALGVFLLLARVLFRNTATVDADRVATLMALDEREAIVDPRLLRRSLGVLGAVLVGFLLQQQTGVAPSIVAVVGAGVLLLLSPLRPADVVPDVEWETLLFFLGLFVLVGALVHVGALERLARGLTNLTGGAVVPTLLVVLIGSAVISAVVDNIPYVTAMAPVVASLIAANPALGRDGALWWALALGADLGGNATIVGASANVVIVGIAERNGFHISFRAWLRYGLPTTLSSLAVAVPYIVLRYG